MRAGLTGGLVALALAGSAAAQVEPVTVRVPDPEGWVGERVPVIVELRAQGSFAGTAAFDLPELPGTLFLKVGSPVVSSEVIEGQSWFVQAHEFALFSQSPGRLEVPPFAVRFSHHEGFTGPEREVRARAPGCTLEIRRPPGSEALGFLVTTESLELEERWTPEPGPVRVGATFRRGIVQRAAGLSGMALAPAPAGAPEGVRVYPGTATTKDRLERGAFEGERREELTYLLTRPGSVTLPALTYVWWNPRTETLRSKTLPAVTVEVAPAPAVATRTDGSGARGRWIGWLAAALAIGLGAWRARALAAWARRVRGRIDPPERVAARRLLHACRAGDADAAASAWETWRGTQDRAFRPGPELQSALLGLHRTHYAARPAERWTGLELARSFRAEVARSRTRRARGGLSPLPALNPTGRRPQARPGDPFR